MIGNISYANGWKHAVNQCINKNYGNLILQVKFNILTDKKATNSHIIVHI